MHHRDQHQGIENKGFEHKGINRGRLARATKCVIENLEKRQMLAGDVFNVNKAPTFVPSNGDINDIKNGPLGNVGQAASELYADYRQYIKKGGNASDYEPLYESVLNIRDNKLAMSIRYRGTFAAATSAIRDTGATFIYRGKASRVIDAFIPISQISTIAQDPSVISANPIYRAVAHSVGKAANQAEIGLNADSLRSTFDLDGAGIKIGVISDSVNSVGAGLADSFASGDLPVPSDIDVVDDSSGGSDEGRAMLELIHDIAPKASLAFATRGDSQQTMAANIQRLYDAGCDVIVDDIYIGGEPQFQEGIISAAITSVTAKGVVYVSAVGNSGGGGFTSYTRWIETPGTEIAMDWDKSPDHVDTSMRVDIGDGSGIQLQWDNPFNGIVGVPTTDLDITLSDPSTGQIVARGISNNFATGIPAEFISAPAGTYNLTVSVANRVEGSTLPSRIAVFHVAGEGSFKKLEYKQSTRTAALGHNAAIDALSVGATPFYETPAYDSDGVIQTESFTAEGPAISEFKINGERRNRPKVFLKPDLTAVDNVNTSFFGADVTQDPDKLLNFAGTSAAAPNAAAVAALLVQLARARGLTFTPDTIKNAMIESAKLQPVNGAAAGEWDKRGGYGLLDGVAAARILVPDVPSPDVQRVTPLDSPRGIDTLTIEFSEPVTGFDLADISLTRKGVNVLDGNQTLTTDDNKTFILSGLKKITDRRGTYKFNVDGATIVDADNNTAFSTTEIFYVSGKPTNVVVTAISPSELNVSWFDNGVGEQAYRVYRSLDPSFTDNKVFDLGPNVTKLRDTGLVPATRYYYKVLPVYQDIAINSLPSTTVDGFTLAANEIVVDNLSTTGVKVDGEWSSVSSGNKWGVNYLTDNNSGKGDKAVTFTPNIREAGEYLVYIRWTAADNRSTKVPVTVSSSGGAKTTTNVNQRQNTTWKLIGKFTFEKGRKGYVQISNLGTKGVVVADAARFVKTDNGDTPPIDNGTTFD